MAFWLIKSEPRVYAWDQLLRDGSTLWDGVRNVVARNNLLAMKCGDRALFYHSNDGLCMVGVAEVVESAIPDVTVTPNKLTKNGLNPWVVVRVAPVAALVKPVTLAMVKAEPRLVDMALVKYSRLSVQPVTPAEWQVIMELTGGLVA